MKKKIIFSLLICSLLLSFSLYAQTPNYAVACANKTKQGVANILTSWLEVPCQIAKGFNHGFGGEGKSQIIGGFFGFFRGIIHGVGRLGCGCIQLATFFLPNPQNNDGVGIPLDSQFAWEEGTQYSIVNQGIEPVGRKAFRGIINTLFWPLEFPGQLVKGFRQDKPFKGIAKALTFPFARLGYGIYDLTTVVLPNETEGYGYPLNEKLPWDAFVQEEWDNETIGATTTEENKK